MLQPVLWPIGVVPELPLRKDPERDREVQRRDQAGLRGAGQRALEAKVSGRR